MPSDFQSELTEIQSEIENALESRLNACDWPDSLRRAVQYSLMAGGKRLRPALVLKAAEACGADRNAAMPAACAIEMVHTYSLIHDDLPCMDDDDVRRGRPTSHRVFGEALATLAGDVLLTFAFETIGQLDGRPAITADCLSILSQAAGGGGMVGGQILDLEAERGHLRGCEWESGVEVSGPEGKAGDGTDSVADGPSDLPAIRVEQLTRVHRMKTGALITASLQLGSAVAGASEEFRQALTTYGQKVGLAFQIADDLLDVTGTNEKLGKETGRDNDLGKLTYPSLIGIEASRVKAETLVQEACRALSVFHGRADWFVQLARFIVERDH